MKESFERMRDLMRGAAERVTRAINPPLAEDAGPLDIRQAIVEAIEGRVQPVAGGRRVLPDGHVKVRVLAPDASHERALQTALADVMDLAARRLRELRCDVDPGFRVDVVYVRKRPAHWPDAQPMTIDFEPPAPPAAAPPQPALVLTITKGHASSERYALTEPIVRVGRSQSPVDQQGRLRHNHVAFLEDGDEASLTVGRGHCEIRYQPSSGQYRIFDERSANGTRIVRGGEVIAVPAMDPYGVAIAAGDELQFGSAVARVDIEPA